MLFISISPKCSARITIPWTALIYVPAPHPVPNLTGSCRDTLIEWELGTDLRGRRCVSACLFIHLAFLFFFFAPLNRRRFTVDSCHDGREARLCYGPRVPTANASWTDQLRSADCTTFHKDTAIQPWVTLSKPPPQTTHKLVRVGCWFLLCELV